MTPLRSLIRLPASVLERLPEAVDALIALPPLLAATVEELRLTREEVVRANQQIERQVRTLEAEIDTLDRELDTLDESLVPAAERIEGELGRLLELGDRLAVSLQQLASGMSDIPLIDAEPDEEVGADPDRGGRDGPH